MDEIPYYKVVNGKNVAGTQDIYFVLAGKEEVLVNKFLDEEIAIDFAMILNEVHDRRIQDESF